MNTVRLILAGFGAMSKLAWYPLLRKTEGVELAACVDPVMEAFREEIETGRLSKNCCFESFEEAVAKVRADGVIVVTPPEQHEAVVTAALKAGLPVLCEKPLAPTIESAMRMNAVAENCGVPLMVAQNRRHTPCIHTMKRLLEEGTFGKPGQVYVTFRQIFTRDSFRDRMRHPLLLDMANHHFDAIRGVLGEEADGVTAVGWNPEWSRFDGIGSAVAVFDYRRNLRVVYDGSWHTMSGNMTFNGCDWRIECENGVIVCQGDRVYTAGRGDYPSGSRGAELVEIPLEKMDCELGEWLLQEFLQVIRDKKIPETSGKDNIHTLQMVFAAVESVDTQKHVKISQSSQYENGRRISPAGGGKG